MKKYDVETVVKSLKAYREATHERDIEVFGENYWKNKVLAIHGKNLTDGTEWIDLHSEEIAEGLDMNISMLELADVINKYF